MIGSGAGPSVAYANNTTVGDVRGGGGSTATAKRQVPQKVRCTTSSGFGGRA